MNAVTPPTPENVAEMLTDGDNEYHDGHHWDLSLTSVDNVVNICVTPYDVDDSEMLAPVRFRAVVVEGEEAPIVLDPPAELGLTWLDGGPLLELGDEGICLFPRGADEYWMDPSEAREWASQLAVMADAYEAAHGKRECTGEMVDGSWYGCGYTGCDTCEAYRSGAE